MERLAYSSDKSQFGAGSGKDIYQGVLFADKLIYIQLGQHCKECVLCGGFVKNLINCGVRVHI